MNPAGPKTYTPFFYAQIPDDADLVFSRMDKAHLAAEEGKIWVSRTHTLCALSYCALNIAWYTLNAGVVIVSGLIRLEFSTIYTKTSKNISASGASFLLAAEAAMYIFLSLFNPSKYNFKKPGPPPSDEPRNQENGDSSNQSLADSSADGGKSPSQFLQECREPNKTPLQELELSRSSPFEKSTGSADANKAPFYEEEPADSLSILADAIQRSLIADESKEEDPLFFLDASQGFEEEEKVPFASSSSSIAKSALLDVKVDLLQDERNARFEEEKLSPANSSSSDEKLRSPLPSLHERIADIWEIHGSQIIRYETPKNNPESKAPSPPIATEDKAFDFKIDASVEEAVSVPQSPVTKGLSPISHLNQEMQKLGMMQSSQLMPKTPSHILLETAKQMKYWEAFSQLKWDESGDIFLLRKRLLKLEKTPFVNACLDLVSHLNNQAPVTDIRNRYRELILALRKVIHHEGYKSIVESKELSQTDALLVKTIHKVCDKRYTLDLGAYKKNLLELHLASSDTDLSLENFWDRFESANTQLNLQQNTHIREVAGVILQRLKGHCNLGFDPTLQTNVPNRRSVFACEGHFIDILQHGDPLKQTDLISPFIKSARELLKKVGYEVDEETIEGIIPKEAELVADYQGFLNHLEKQEKNLLHIVLEKRKPQILGDESTRAKIRLDLENTHNHVLALALTLDGSFFKGTDKYSRIRTFVELKARLLHKLKTDTKDFHLPKRFRENLNHMRVLEEIADEVHTIFFDEKRRVLRIQEPGTSSYRIDDHRSYLLIFYAYLTLHIFSEFKISAVEAICKDDIDRGNAFKATLELLFLLLAGKIDDKDSLNWVFTNTLAAPLMVRKTGLIDNRAVFLKYVLSVFTKMTPLQKESLKRGRLKALGAKEMTVVAVDGQSATHRAQTLSSLEDYKGWIKDQLNTVIQIEPSVKNILHDISLGKAFRDTNGALKKEAIYKQIDRDCPSMQITCSGQRAKTAADIESYLVKNKVAQEEILEVLSGCQQGLSVDLLQKKSALFANPSLKLIIKQKTESQEFDAQLSIEAKEGIVSLKFTFVSDVVHLDEINTPLASLIGTLFIESHKSGKASYAIAVKQL